MLYLCHLVLYLVIGAVEGRVPGDHGVAEGVPVLLGAVHPQAAGDVLGVDGAVTGQCGVDAADAGVVRRAGANHRSVSSGVTTRGQCSYLGSLVQPIQLRPATVARLAASSRRPDPAHNMFNISE